MTHTDGQAETGRPAELSANNRNHNEQSVRLDSLARRLREETQQAHTDAEESTFMVDLLSGRLGVAAFVALQQQALLFYSAMERTVDDLSIDSRVARIADRRLDRAEKLRHDLEQLGAESDPNAIQPLPATQDYIAELEAIRREGDAAGIIAHHYVRYLGDLSGGQIIATKMQRLLGIDPEALTFYSFEDIGKLKPYKDAYRAQLDALQDFLTPEEQDDLVAAASVAFTCNHKVFRDLDRLYPASAEGIAQ